MPTQPNVPLTDRWLLPPPVRRYFHEYQLAWQDPYGYRRGCYEDSYCHRRWIAPPARFGIIRMMVWTAIFVWVVPFLIGYALAVLTVWALYIAVRALYHLAEAGWQRYSTWQDPDNR